MGAKFSGGIALPHQAEHKEETANLPVQTLAPPQVVIPMAQGLARPGTAGGGAGTDGEEG